MSEGSQQPQVQGARDRPLHPLAVSSHSNLYVNNVPHDLGHATLERLFSPYGVVESLRLVKNRVPGGKSFAFVKMGSITEATAAIQGLNGAHLGQGVGQCVLEVKFADADAGERNPEIVVMPSDNLYIKHLPMWFSEADLRGLFGAHGTVVESRVLHAGDGGAGALVRMGSVAEATAAIQALHNSHQPGGAATAPALVVRYADSAAQKAKRVNKKRQDEPTLQAQMAGVNLGGPVALPAALAQAASPSQGAGSFNRAYGKAPQQPLLPPAAAGPSYNLQPPPPSMLQPGLLRTSSGYEGLESRYASLAGMPAPPPQQQQQQQHTPQVNPSALLQPTTEGLTYQPRHGDLTMLQLVAPPPPALQPSFTPAIDALATAAAGSLASVSVTNLPAADASLLRLFLYENCAPFGAVLGVSIIQDDYLGNSQSKGFVVFADHTAAARALHKLRGLVLGGRQLSATFELHATGVL